jgi:hypothetical protein
MNIFLLSMPIPSFVFYAIYPFPATLDEDGDALAAAVAEADDAYFASRRTISHMRASSSCPFPPRAVLFDHIRDTAHGFAAAGHDDAGLASIPPARDLVVCAIDYHIVKAIFILIPLCLSVN